MSTAGLRDFKLDLSRFGELTIEKHTELCRAITLRVLRGVVLKSPVDTGAFRANWQTSLGIPAQGTLQSVINDAIARGAVTVAKAQKFPLIFVSNNLPYGPALEDGHSRQAPYGMVELTLNEVQTFVSGG